MAEKSSNTIIEKENFAKRLKRNFDSWREIVLLLNSVFLWRKQTHPWIIFVTTTLFFLALLYYNPSFLTTVSLIGFVLTILDFLGPILSSAIWKQESWSALKERELEEICKSLSGTLISIKYQLTGIRDMRSTRPNMFYPTAVIVLGILAWIGNSVNNLFITYLLVLNLVLMPGLLHYGIVQKVYQTATLHIANLLHSISANPKKIQ